jgi:hypothetical protein
MQATSLILPTLRLEQALTDSRVGGARARGLAEVRTPWFGYQDAYLLNTELRLGRRPGQVITVYSPLSRTNRFAQWSARSEFFLACRHAMPRVIYVAIDRYTRSAPRNNGTSCKNNAAVGCLADNSKRFFTNNHAQGPAVAVC